MGQAKQVFTTGERRTAGLILLSGVVLTLSIVALEPAFRPSLGVYETASSVPNPSNVIDARPTAAS